MENINLISEFYKMFSPCILCPLMCNVNRLKGEIGKCNSGTTAKISSPVLYKGEEPPLSGRNG
jgi:putative pyruvate formate lyase activating enzyme